MQPSIPLDELHTSFKKAYRDISEKNWDNELTSYLNEIGTFSANPADERMVTGWVAGLCEHAYYVAAHTKSDDIRSDFEHKLKKVINSAILPKFLTCPGSVVCGKKQPSFIGSITPTLERFQVMERLAKVFGAGIDAIIVGGSMSYIPFFGIRENPETKDFSDIDTLIVINDDFFKKSSWEGFMQNNLFPMTEKETFLNRIDIFHKLYQDCSADVFSQKFSVIEKSFTVSNHFVTRQTFERMILKDLKESLQERKDREYIMRDFRTNLFTHPCHARHTFDGQRLESIIDGHGLETGGFISNMPGFIISDGKFYPGVYQTVISPAFLVFYDRTKKTTDLVKKFENILYQEVERTREHSLSATYAKAHNRYDIFPPGRYDEGHDSYLSDQKIKKYLPPRDFSILEIKSELLPEETVNDGIRNSKKNVCLRNETKNSLEEWKKETLKNAGIEIEKIISRSDDFKKMMSLAKEQGHHWFTIARISGVKKIIVELPDPYIDSSSDNQVIRKEIHVQTITPSDIMRLNAYEKLAQKSGKVYVESIIDPADKHRHSPISYAVIVPVL